mmetsp:Transcript_28481/g.67680  ORF Transcript_28481/g.67680 Transcript_28481/m.67680 type:complete len:244 (-) Transcript_28481:1249-1980(-)
MDRRHCGRRLLGQKLHTHRMAITEGFACNLLGVLIAGKSLGEALGASDLPPMRDGLDADLMLREGQIYEAILVVLAILRGLRLAGDAAPAAAHNPGRGLDEIRLVVHVDLLHVAMCREKQVHTVGGGQALPLVQAMLCREVSGDDLPVGLGLAQALLQPPDLRIPQVLEPLRALLYRDGSRQTAGRGGIVVQAPANVVAAGGMVVEGIPNVAVNKENVHGKVRELDWCGIVQGRLHPASCTEM